MKQDKIKQSCFEKSHDVIVSILGNVVAIDVTTDPKVCQQKKTKLKQLLPLLDQLGIDSVGVFCADESWEIWDRIKAIAKSTEIANQKEKDIRLLNWVFGFGGGLSMTDRPFSEVL